MGGARMESGSNLPAQSIQSATFDFGLRLFRRLLRHSISARPTGRPPAAAVRVEPPVIPLCGVGGRSAPFACGFYGPLGASPVTLLLSSPLTVAGRLRACPARGSVSALRV